jgi:hypothetical protein
MGAEMTLLRAKPTARVSHRCGIKFSTIPCNMVRERASGVPIVNSCQEQRASA